MIRIQQEPACTAVRNRALCTNFQVTFSVAAAGSVVDVECLGPCFPETACIFNVTDPATSESAVYRITLNSVTQNGTHQRWCYAVHVQGTLPLTGFAIQLCETPPMIPTGSVTRNGIITPFSVDSQPLLGGKMGILFTEGVTQSNGTVFYCFDLIGTFGQTPRDVAVLGGTVSSINEGCQPGPACPCPVPKNP
ncbi:MAG: hypothetical protein GX316_11140 [Firmicutes bacterium]|nr:hypothetical protein [Bacillota bacterium]